MTNFWLLDICIFDIITTIGVVNEVMKRYVLLFCLIYFICFNSIFASETSGKCDYSDEYIKWSKLSEEEKKNSIMPKVCEDSTYNNLLKKKSLKSFDIVSENLLPEKYDLRDISGNSYITDVKNQHSTSTCWLFSMVSSVESNILKNYNQTYDLSEIYGAYSTGYNYFLDGVNENGINNKIVDSGGNKYYASGYLMRNGGLILESEFPFDSYYLSEKTNNNYLKEISLSELNKKSVVDVNDAIFYSYDSCNSTSIKKIKELIMKYGAVSASYYDDNAYISENNMYYYNGTEYSNHSVSIIGWDDNADTSLFRSDITPSNKGAFIIKNSWGTSSRDNGYFYISYEDSKICTNLAVYDNVDFDIEDNVYYYDNLGYNLGYGYSDSNVSWGANVFKKNSDNYQILKEVSIGFNKKADYLVYYADSNDLNNRKLIYSGSTDSGGYNTIKLDTPILVSDDFSIIVRYSGDSPYSMGVQSGDVSGYENTWSGEGICFISKDGEEWYNLSDSNAVISIKAYTDNLDYDFDIKDISYTDGKDIYNVCLDTSNINNGDYEISITDENEEDVTNKFSIKSDSLNSFSFFRNDKECSGEYNLVVKYGYITKTKKFNLNEYIYVDDISVSNPDISIYENEEYDLGKIYSLTPTDASNRMIKYELSNDNINVVNDTIYGKKIGNSIIKIVSLDNNLIFKEINVNVLAIPYYNFDQSIKVLKNNDKDYLSGLNVGSIYSDLLSKSDSNQSISLYKNDELIDDKDSSIASCMKYSIGENNFYLIVEGDVNGNGLLDIGDVSAAYSAFRNNSLGITNNLDFCYLKSAEVNDTDGLDIGDISMLYSKFRDNM